MVDKSKSSNLYEAFLESTSNLKSRTLDRCEDVRDNADEYKERAINGLKKTAVGLAAVGMLAGATPALAEDTNKEITVPLSQVTQHVEECELSADQWSQEEVTISPECVREDYLKEIGYGETEEESEQTSSSDQEALVEMSEYGGDLEDFQVEEFRIHNFDGDPEVEGVLADNQTVNGQKRAVIALYPFGEKGGEPHNTIYVAEGQHVNEIREGELDGDEMKEFGVFLDDYALTGDWNMEGRVDWRKYSAPDGKQISDGQFVDGRPVVSLDEELSSEKKQWGVYWIDENGLEPFKHENFDIRNFVHKLESGTYTLTGAPIDNEPIEHFVYGDINGDNVNEFSFVNDRDLKNRSSNDLVTIIDGDGSHEQVVTIGPGDVLDLDIGNTTPWSDDSDELLIPCKDILAGYKSDNPSGLKVVISSAWKKSDKEITDFQNLPYNEMVDGEWNIEKWTKKYNYKAFPRVISIAASGDEGLLVAKDKYFRDNTPDSRKPYFLDFKYSDFLEAYKDMDIEEIGRW